MLDVSVACVAPARAWGVPKEKKLGGIMKKLHPRVTTEFGKRGRTIFG